MSVQASESMSDVWTMWQGHVVNGVYPLGRYLGCSDHSGVFLTKFAAQGDAEVALKLIPADRGQSEVQLPRWRQIAELAQPHLLPLLDFGECQLDGLPYLYVVMEYADQTLAQLLQHRVLTDDEAREMLPPILDALTYLHGKSLILGQLKPSNILVVGDRLKLASDSTRGVGEEPLSSNAATAYDPLPTLTGARATADDVWALGVTLLEGLALRSPANRGENRDPVTLPANFSPAFRDIVARCLSPLPQDRPQLAELVAWAGGSAPAIPAAIVQPATARVPEPKTLSAPASPTVPSPIVSEAAQPPLSHLPTKKPQKLAVLILAALVILTVGLIAARLLSIRPAPVAPPEMPNTAVPVPDASVSAASAINPGGSDLAGAPSVLHEVIPDVSQRARRSIRGHIMVSVPVTIEPTGSVSAAAADTSQAKKYFRRLAVDAAKKWTFSPLNTASKRFMQIQFDFSRDGTTGQALAVR